MTKTVRFWGASDDLVEIEGEVLGCDEYDAYACDRGVNAVFRIKAPDHSMNVLCIYGVSGGTWCFAPALVDEDWAWPPWPISIRRAAPYGGLGDHYSTELVIEVPDDASIEEVEEPAS